LNVSLSSPDGLGDFVLRLPMIQALVESGHRLQLLMRPPAAELAATLLPEAEVHVIGRDPWHKDTQRQRGAFAADFAAIDRFGPEVFVAGAFQPTIFEREWMAANSGRVRSVGFMRADGGGHPVPDWSVAVPVPVEMPEWEKFRHMAVAVAGAGLDFGPPRRPTPDGLRAADAMLADLGFPREGFHIVCVGNRPGLALKDWGEANWARFLALVGQEHGRPMLFLGNPKEAASIERIRRSLPRGVPSASLAEAPPSMPVAHALIARSGAYLGRDSGPMHLAAATGRPLLALFGGGHWPRFLPPAARGVILTSATPCRGCNFECPFPEPYCVSGVPFEAVVEAWRSLPHADALRVVELAPDAGWLAMHDRVMAGRQQGAARPGLLRSAWNRVFGGA
jgi:ADP-heptose:LPS heptosyltransferase